MKPIHEEITLQEKRGVLLVLTGPSGAGKDTVFAKLLEKNPSIKKIISTTSREKRHSETEGDPYHFVSREEFERLIGDGAFFEWVEFRGELYGTQKQTLLEGLANGDDVIWHIEAKGVKNIKHKIKEMVPRSVFVFLTAPDIEMMHERVIHAEGDAANVRWNEPLVVWELKQYADCEYLVINQDGKLDQAVQCVQSIIEAKRLEIIPEDYRGSKE